MQQPQRDATFAGLTKKRRILAPGNCPLLSRWGRCSTYVLRNANPALAGSEIPCQSRFLVVGDTGIENIGEPVADSSTWGYVPRRSGALTASVPSSILPHGPEAPSTPGWG